MILAIEESFTVGQDTYVSSVSPHSSFAVAFEDDLATGYFYAMETVPSLNVLDALHIYNVVNVIDKSKPSTIQITWSESGMTAFLFINKYCHAVFDFESKEGYCRTAFPNSNGKWSNIKDRTLTDVVLDKLFSKEKKA